MFMLQLHWRRSSSNSTVCYKVWSHSCFSIRLKTSVNKSTVHSIRQSYDEWVKWARSENEEIPVSLPPKKRGRHLLLGEKLDQHVQLYLRRVWEAGGVVTAAIVKAAAKGIIMSEDKYKLVEYGGYINLTLIWAQSLLTRKNFVKRKSITAKSKLIHWNLLSWKLVSLRNYRLLLKWKNSHQQWS